MDDGDIHLKLLSFLSLSLSLRKIAEISDAFSRMNWINLRSRAIYQSIIFIAVARSNYRFHCRAIWCVELLSWWRYSVRKQIRDSRRSFLLSRHNVFPIHTGLPPVFAKQDLKLLLVASQEDHLLFPATWSSIDIPLWVPHAEPAPLAFVGMTVCTPMIGIWKESHEMQRPTH